MTKKIKLTQVRSAIRNHRNHARTLECLGLGRIGDVAEHVVNPSLLGMVRSVAHLVEVTAADGKGSASTGKSVAAH